MVEISIESLQIDERWNAYLFFLATSSLHKQSQLMNLLLADERYFYGESVEGVGGFHEPESDDVEKIAWMKAMMGLALVGHLTEEDVLHYGVVQKKEGEELEPILRAKILGPEEMKKKTISLAGDVATAYAPTFESFFDENQKDQVVNFHNLKRQAEGKNPDGIKALIENDRKIWTEKYTQTSFWVRFKIANAAVSSDMLLNNAAKVEFYAEFNQLPEDIFNDAYDDQEEVLKVGPRVNLAKLVLPEYVKRVIMIDTLTGLRRELREDEYKMVERAVIGAVLPNEYYEKLFSQQLGPIRIRD